jgi:hypothetical protein
MNRDFRRKSTNSVFFDKPREIFHSALANYLRTPAVSRGVLTALRLNYAGSLGSLALAAM